MWNVLKELTCISIQDIATFFNKQKLKLQKRQRVQKLHASFSYKPMNYNQSETERGREQGRL